MQLFAIIGNSSHIEEQGFSTSQRSNVEYFLRQHVALNQVNSYLETYDSYYQQQLARATAKRKSLKHTSSSSVRVLRICAQINEELTLTQKFIVLSRLIEFARISGGEVEGQEMEFIVTVSDSFYIDREELNDLLFFLGSIDIPTDTPHSDFPLLAITSERCTANVTAQRRTIYRESLEGEIYILLLQRANLYLLRYLGQQQLFLGAQALVPNALHILSTGTNIRGAALKPVFYSDIVARFAPKGLRDQVNISAEGITYRFPSGDIGLHNVSFSHSGGQLVGIMGSSGAGKSTLLNVINGSTKPHQGSVSINGTDIYAHPKAVEGISGFVSQDDLLIEELTVYQNLLFSAKLSFANYPPEAIAALVDETLHALGLYAVRHLQVGSPLNKRISGGQRKRLNIALELIRQPSILFLDEPTSGLSSRDSENLMLLLKELALKGKLVYVVIHQPSSDIFKMFDEIVILDTGGYLIYSGDPVESIGYFQNQGHLVETYQQECSACGNVNPELIFSIVENPVVDEYGNTTRQRRTEPVEWAARFAQIEGATGQKTSAQQQQYPPIDQIPRSTKIPAWLRQLRVFIKRDALAKLANRQYMAINILEAPILAALLAYIIRYYKTLGVHEATYTLMDNTNLPVYLFTAVIVAFFVGLSGSAEDIIKDRKIRKREAFLNLSWGAYLSAKMVNMILIALYQSFLFTLIGNLILSIQGMLFAYWLILFLTWVAAGTLGLLISDSFRSVVAIYILIPFLVIPQIILSGIIVRFDRLNPSISNPETIPLYGEIIVARWAFEALAVHQYKNNAYQRPLYDYEQTMSLADYKRNYWIRELAIRLDRLDTCSLPAQAATDWRLLCQELQDDTDPIRGSGIPISNLTLSPLNPPDSTQISLLASHLDRLTSYYGRLYSVASQRRDSLLRNMQGITPAQHDAFKQFKQAHYNTALAQFARTSDAVERIAEYNGHLVQLYDPIFQLPRSSYIKAPFYAPYKRLGTIYIDTYWVNTLFLLLTIVITYILLYTRALKRLLDWLAKPF